MTLRPSTGSGAQGERSIGVIGAGAWGTALAQMLAADGREVLLWAREPELADEINDLRTNSLFLPSATLAPTIRATSALADCAGVTSSRMSQAAASARSPVARIDGASPAEGR